MFIPFFLLPKITNFQNNKSNVIITTSTEIYDVISMFYHLSIIWPLVVSDVWLSAIGCSIRSSTIRINWAAYPHYSAPEKFAPYILDGKHLYYINAFENAASTIETSAVSAQNVVRLLLSRISAGVIKTPIEKDGNQQSEVEDLELWAVGLHLLSVLCD